MKRIPTIFSFLLAVVSLILCFISLPAPSWISPLCALSSWLVSLGMVKKMAHFADMTCNLFALVMLGFSLDHFSGKFPLFLIMSLMFGMVYMLRTMFLKQLGYVKANWLEPFAYAASIAGYIYANVVSQSGWQGWALPVPVLAFISINTFGAVSTSIAYRKSATKEYNADIGKPAPDFSLPDEESNAVKLSDYAGKQLVLLLFIRGDWCPTCHIMLRTYQREVQKFRDKNVMLFAICADDIGVNKEMVGKLDLAYRILSDKKQEVLRLYGIQYQEGVMGTNYEMGVPMPASILIDKRGIVRYISRADRAGDFLNPMQIFSVLEKLES